MDFSKMMGQNILRLAFEKKISLDAVAEASGLTAKDLGRIVDGRLLVAPDILENVSESLGVDILQLMTFDEEECRYMECMTRFKDNTKKALLLDIIDTYVDLEERM